MLKKMFLLLALAVTPVVFGQSQHSWNCFPEATLSNDIYWNHQPTEVRVLRNMAESDPGRGSKAMELAVKGYVIDVAIMVWNWDPVCTMGIRINQGFTWVPSALQKPIPVMPGLDFPGLPKYDANNPPAGSIKVSLEAKDYPPFDPPAPPAVPQTNIVGNCYQGDGRVICGLGPGADVGKIKDGDLAAKDGKNYVAHVSVGLMGKAVYFTQVN